jgi:hypothetical protein
MPKFYFVHEVVRYDAGGRVSEVLPGVWEAEPLLDRIGQARLDELVRYPKLVEEIIQPGS